MESSSYADSRLNPESDVFVPSSPFPAGIPILAVASYTFKDLPSISALLNYKLQTYKRSLILEKSTLYQTEYIDEKALQEHKALLVFINWNENHEQQFLTELESLKKHELPQRLIGYCKKNPIEIKQKVSENFGKTREKIQELKKIYEKVVIEINDMDSHQICEKILTKISELESGKFGSDEKGIAESFAKGMKINEEQEKVMNEEEKGRREVSNNGKGVEKGRIPVTYLLLPMGIPGMGKTFLMQTLKKFFQSKAIDFFTLSSDEIRGESMKEYKKRNLGQPDEKVFAKTAKTSQKNYYRLLFSAIESNKSILVIYCDKTHPPDGLESLQKNLKSLNCPSSIKLISIAPQCGSPMSFPNRNYEFSIDLIKLCLYRVLKREFHQTLTGPNSRKLGIVFEMLNLYKNYHFSDCLSAGIDYLIQIPFTHSDLTPSNKENSEISELENLIFLQIQNKSDKNSLEKISEKIIESQVEVLFSNEAFVTKALSPIFNFASAPSGPLANQSLVHKTIPFQSSPPNPEEKKKNSSQNVKKSKIKPCTYIGIDLKSSLESSIVARILLCLSEIQSFYEDDSRIGNDISQISKFNEGLKSRWKFPRSLHVTSLFIGGNRSKLTQKEFVTFEEDVLVKVQLSHFVYSPNCLICAKVKVVDEGKILIENEIPHITLLLCDDKPPKYSNSLLQKAFFGMEINKNCFKEEKASQVVYTCPFTTEIVCEGITKRFF